MFWTMDEMITPYLLLAGSAFASQALLVVPIVPLLLLTGALAARGELQILWAVAALVIAIESGDFLWYLIGRRGGSTVLNRVCRLTMEPNTCVRRTQNLFGRYGARALLVAKFIPGLSTVALPLAGVFGMQRRRFVLYDAFGVLLWCSAYVTAGYVSSQQVAAIGQHIPTPSLNTAGAVAAVLGIYLVWKYVRRRQVVRQLRMPRVPVGELWRKMEAGERVAVVDLRHRIDVERDPYAIPHALYIPAEELSVRQQEIPRDREVVLYCTCPDEITSARWALRLREMGIGEVRPLEGGFTAWRAAGFPVNFVGPLVPPHERILNAA
jgi:membrane protein DedA with SNARE-associated domain/rhodanese-related sulfurtransferase